MKYDAGQEMRTSIRDTFSEIMGTQIELRNHFTKNPPNLRFRKEQEELLAEGLVNKNGLIVSQQTLEPVDQIIIDKVMARIDERMLTEGNPDLKEYNFNYIGGKILPIAEVKN